MYLTTTLLLASLAPQGAQDQKPMPSIQNMEDIKTEWIAPAKAPLTAAELASQGTSSTEEDFKSELPAAIEGAAFRVDRDRMFYDYPGDGNLWVRGRSYKASFGLDGATYVPAFGASAPRNFPIELSVTDVTVGGQPLEFQRAASATHDADVVAFDRGSFVERYDMSLESMEQKFFFESLPNVGDLNVDIAVGTELVMSAGPGGSIHFANEFGEVGYSSAVVVDAAGSVTPILTQWESGSIRLHVSADVLAECTFPITIDPVISSMTFASGSDTTYNPDAAFDATNNRFLVIWEDVYSSSDHDVWGEYWGPDGAFIGDGAWIDYTTDNWVNPHVANNNLSDTFLVVAQRGSNNNRRITGRLRYASGSTQDAQFVIDSGGTGERYNADVGGDPVLVGPTYFCVVFEREYNSGSDHDVHAQMVTSTGQLSGGNILIDNSGSTLDRYPRISRSNGAAPWSTQRWNVVWNRRYSSSDEDVRGAQLDWDGDIVTSSFSVDYSAQDDEWPTVSSPLDDSNGERPYLAVYERASFSGGVVMGSVLLDGVRLSNPNISALEGVTDRTRLLPSVDSDGQSFIVGAGRRFSTSTTDFDIYVSTFSLSGNDLVALETNTNLAFSGSNEYDLNLASAYSSGGPRQLCMGVWTDYSSDHDVEGAIYEAPVPTLGVAYCTAGVNSTGQPALISATGSPSLSDQDITLEVSGLPLNQPGLFYFGMTPTESTFGDGFRCVSGQVYRMYSFVNSGTNGVATRAVNWSSGYATSLTVGDMYFQLWYRDTAAMQTGFNLSDGYHIVMVP